MVEDAGRGPVGADGRWEDFDDRRAWLAFLAVTMNLVPQLDAHHKRHFGITHVEYSVLIGLAESPEQAAQLSVIAGQVHASLSRVSHIVRRLERAGYLALGPSETDGRATVATLTDAGRSLLARSADETMAEVRRLLFDPLTKQQREQLAEISMTLMTAWKPSSARPWHPWSE